MHNPEAHFVAFCLAHRNKSTFSPFLKKFWPICPQKKKSKEQYQSKIYFFLKSWELYGHYETMIVLCYTNTDVKLLNSIMGRRASSFEDTWKVINYKWHLRTCSIWHRIFWTLLETHFENMRQGMRSYICTNYQSKKQTVFKDLSFVLRNVLG